MVGLEAGPPDGVDAVPGERQPVPGERVPDPRDVAAERGVQRAEPADRRGAEFELPARLVGDLAAADRRPGVGDERAHPPGGDVRGGRGGVDHEPLGLRADRPGRAGLEADTANVLVDAINRQAGHR